MTHKQADRLVVSYIQLLILSLLLPAACSWIPKWKANQLTTHQFLIIEVSLLTALSFQIQPRSVFTSVQW